MNPVCANSTVTIIRPVACNFSTGNDGSETPRFKTNLLCSLELFLNSASLMSSDVEVHNYLFYTHSVGRNFLSPSLLTVRVRADRSLGKGRKIWDRLLFIVLHAPRVTIKKGVCTQKKSSRWSNQKVKKTLQINSCSSDMRKMLQTCNFDNNKTK